MTKKPISWTLFVWILLTMTVVAFGMDMAINPTLRNQAGSIHSEFWRFAFPVQIVSNAVVAIAVRFIANWRFTKQDHPGL